MKVEVTSEHIERGVSRDGHACPVYLALLDAYRREGYRGVTVSVYTEWTSVWQTWRDGPHKVDHPELVRAFIREFDRGHDVEPFGFEHDAPQEKTP